MSHHISMVVPHLARTLESIERWIEGALLNAQNICGQALESAGNAIPVQRRLVENSEDEKIRLLSRIYG